MFPPRTNLSHFKTIFEEEVSGCFAFRATGLPISMKEVELMNAVLLFLYFSPFLPLPQK